MARADWAVAEATFIMAEGKISLMRDQEEGIAHPRTISASKRTRHSRFKLTQLIRTTKAPMEVCFI